jgi:hypothetical protein
MADATVVTLGRTVGWTRAGSVGDDGDVLRAGNRPSRVFRRRRRVAVPTHMDVDLGRGPEDDGGLAGVREPRRPKPVPPHLMAALPLPEDETVR